MGSSEIGHHGQRGGCSNVGQQGAEQALNHQGPSNQMFAKPSTHLYLKAMTLTTTAVFTKINIYRNRNRNKVSTFLVCFLGISQAYPILEVQALNLLVHSFVKGVCGGGGRSQSSSSRGQIQKHVSPPGRRQRGCQERF